MKSENLIIAIVILLLMFFNSNAKQTNHDACLMIKAEIESFIDTVKSEKGDVKNHSVYILTILTDNPDYFKFRLESSSDVHYLDNISLNYLATVDSEIVLVQNIDLQTLPLVQCIFPRLVSKEDIRCIKRKLYDVNTFITGQGMYKVCNIKNGKLTTVIYPGQG